MGFTIRRREHLRSLTISQALRTPLWVLLLFSTIQVAPITRPQVFKRFSPTQLAITTRPTVIRRYTATPVAPTARQQVLTRSLPAPLVSPITPLEVPRSFPIRVVATTPPSVMPLDIMQPLAIITSILAREFTVLLEKATPVTSRASTGSRLIQLPQPLWQS